MAKKRQHGFQYVAVVVVMVVIVAANCSVEEGSESWTEWAKDKISDGLRFKDSESVKDKIHDAASEAGRYGADKASEAREKASETAQAAKDKAYETAQAAKDKAFETAHKAGEAVHPAKQTDHNAKDKQQFETEETLKDHLKDKLTSTSDSEL